MGSLHALSPYNHIAHSQPPTRGPACHEHTPSSVAGILSLEAMAVLEVARLDHPTLFVEEHQAHDWLLRIHVILPAHLPLSLRAVGNDFAIAKAHFNVENVIGAA